MGNMSGRSETLANILEDLYKHPSMHEDRMVVFEELQKYEALVFTAHQALLTGTKVPDQVAEQLLHLVFEFVYLKRKVLADQALYAATYDSLLEQNQPLTVLDLTEDSDSEDSEDYNGTCDVLFPNNPRQENGVPPENIVSDTESD